MAIRDLTSRITERMLTHAAPARHDRPHRRQRQPASCPSPARRTSGCRWSEPDVIEREDEAPAARSSPGIDNVCLTIKSERHSLLPGTALAGRPPRGAGHRGRRAQRRPLARGGCRSRHRRRVLRVPRPVERPCCRGTSSTAGSRRRSTGRRSRRASGPRPPSRRDGSPMAAGCCRWCREPERDPCLSLSSPAGTRDD